MKLHADKVSTKIHRPTYPRMRILLSLIIYDWPLKALPVSKKCYHKESEVFTQKMRKNVEEPM